MAVVHHPSYLSNLANLCFRKLKIELKGQRFDNTGDLSELQAVVITLTKKTFKMHSVHTEALGLVSEFLSGLLLR